MDSTEIDKQRENLLTNDNSVTKLRILLSEPNLLFNYKNDHIYFQFV